MKSLNEFYTELDELKKNNPEGVHKYLVDTFNDHQQCCGRHNDIDMACRSELAEYCKAKGNYEYAINYYKDLKEIIASISGTDSAAYVSCLNNMAETYRLTGDLAESQKLFFNAANILESRVGTRDYLYGQVINNIGLNNMMMGENNKAIMNIRNALSVISDLEECKEDTANALVNLGVLYNRTGDNDAALQNLSQAIDIYETDAPDSPSKGAAYNCKGSICFGKGEYAEARECFEKALESLAATAGKTPDYAVCSEWLVYTLAKLGDYDAALAHAEEAAAIYEKFLGADNKKTVSTKALVEKLRP